MGVAVGAVAAAAVLASAGAVATVHAWGERHGIPDRAAEAYAVGVATQPAGCNMTLAKIAGFGAIESAHGTHGGASIGDTGQVSPRIVGPALDGVEFAYVADTDGGEWDGDTRFDRAVGPMQFIPSSFRASMPEGGDPQNYFDSTVAAVRYLCRYGDMADPQTWWRAVYGYNHDAGYVNQVQGRAGSYEDGMPTIDGRGDWHPAATSDARAQLVSADKKTATCPSDACRLLDRAVESGQNAWRWFGGLLHDGDTPRLAKAWDGLDAALRRWIASGTPAAETLGRDTLKRLFPIGLPTVGGLVCPAPDLTVVGEGWGAPRAWAGGAGAHQGQDLLAAEGSRVVSPVDGEVVDVHSADDNMLGRWVVVQAANGDRWMLGHNARNTAKVGDRVSAGQQVAEVGRSGNAAGDVDGPQVHVQFHPDGGKAADPSGIVAACQAALNARETGPSSDAASAAQPTFTVAGDTFVVGDSITVQAQRCGILPANGAKSGGVQVNARDGRAAADAAAIVRSQAKGSTRLVVALGVNDGELTAETVDATVDAVRDAGVKQVIWVNSHGSDGSAAKNQLLAERAAAAGGFRVADWDQVASARPELLADGVHTADCDASKAYVGLFGLRAAA